ncbi:MAG TPA: hypothetical protein VLE70_13580 [Anaerolineae bacterium]|jgi:hypothetical protein|nr:hypothetical protein [Anaerolineae bacterium]
MNSKQAGLSITPRAIAIIAAHALVAWAVCGAIVFVGRQIWTMETTLVVHAIGVPIVFVIVSVIYFTYFNYTTPLQTATIFTLSAIFLDLIVVASIIEKSYAMFSSIIGTWIPFGLMFLTTYLVGNLIAKRKASQAAIVRSS